MACRDPPRVQLYPVQLEIHTTTDLLTRGRFKGTRQESKRVYWVRSHAASVEIDRPIFALASGLKQFAKASCGSPGSSRAGELAKLWKCEGSAALTLLSVIQHSSVQKLFCMMNTAL